jgi:hypothetical protein
MEKTAQPESELLKPKARKALVNAWLVGLLCKEEPRLNADAVEADGRKARRILKDLEAAGYIERPKDWSTSRPEAWHATSRAFDEVVANKPDLCIPLKKYEPAKADLWSVRRENGVFWSHLSEGERKYIVEHVSEYTFVEVKHDGPVVVEPRRLRLQDAQVQDQTFRDTKATLVFDVQFEKALREHLGWGLANLGLIAKADEDVFAARTDSPPLHFSSNRMFGFKPEQWGEDAAKGLTTLREQIAKATRAANVLVEAEEKIQAFGGWEKVLAAYKDLLREALLKAIEKEKAEHAASKKEGGA